MNYFKNKGGNLIQMLIYALVAVIAYTVNISFRGKLSVIAISESIFWMSFVASVFSLATIFLERKVFLGWVKFANYFFIISVAVVLFTPTSTHGLDFLPLIKETVTVAFVILYSLISIIIITYKSLKKDPT